MVPEPKERNMSLFGYSNEPVVTQKDSLGGFSVKPTDVYTITLGHVYITASSGGGKAVNIIGKYEDGTEFKKTIYPTSKKSGTEKNTYTDKDGNTHYLADFLHFDGLCLLTLGKPASQMTTEPKMVKVYNKDQKKEVPTQVDTFTEFNGLQVKLALTRTLKTKQKLEGNTWVDTPDTRSEQDLTKVFRAVDNKTVVEVTNGSEAEFMEAWLEKYQGKDADKTTKKSGSVGAPKAAVAAKPLF